MGLNVSEKKEYTPISEGLHPAICCEVIDLGTQHSEQFGTDSPKILLGWELTDEQREWEGVTRNVVIRKEFTASLSVKANLRKTIESWFAKNMGDQAKDFDLRKLIGKPCQIQIAHAERNGKTYANISAVVSWPKGMPAPKPTVSPVVYEMGSPIPEGTPEWIALKIAAAPEFSKGLDAEMVAAECKDNDLPF